MVADDPELEGQPGFLGKADRCGHPEVRDRDDDVGVDRALAGEFQADALARLVDAAPLNDAVGAGEVDVLEDAEAGARAGRTAGRCCTPRAPIMTISPGSTSRTNSAPMMSSAQVSDARIQASARRPRTSGRTPSGSRTPMISSCESATSE